MIITNKSLVFDALYWDLIKASVLEAETRKVYVEAHDAEVTIRDNLWHPFEDPKYTKALGDACDNRDKKEGVWKAALDDSYVALEKVEKEGVFDYEEFCRDLEEALLSKYKNQHFFRWMFR